MQTSCTALTVIFPKAKTLIALADQMDRSARSVKQNIVEGWKRNSTKEYYEFLGFSIGANAELEEDCMDIWKGIYPGLMGVKGVMGAVSEKGAMGERGATHSSHFTPSFPLASYSPSALSTTLPSFSAHTPFSSPSSPLSLSDIEKLPFYPLNPSLPPVVQLKLRCKELNFLISKLQKSLEDKMTAEHTLPAADRFKKSQIHQRKDKDWYEKTLADQGFARLANGRIVKKK
ncbi:four helix bundle protein [Patescibacteria group bacterium]|nr:MAG: four helix bundle protein [Patescibacteria group bacterium]